MAAARAPAPALRMAKAGCSAREPQHLPPFGSASIGMAAAGGLLSSLNPRLVLFIAGGGGLMAAAAGGLVYTLRGRRARQASQASQLAGPGG